MALQSLRRLHSSVLLLPLILLIGTSGLKAVEATCDPVWPSTRPCNSHGVCLNGTCHCSDGWTGRSDYTDYGGVDCVTNLVVRRVIAALSLAIQATDLVCAILALKRYYGEKGATRLWRPGNAGKNGLWSLGDKPFLVPLYACFAADYFVVDNIGLGILLIVGGAFSWGRAAEGSIRVFRVLLKPLNFRQYRRIRAFILSLIIFMATIHALIVVAILGKGWPLDLGKPYLNQLALSRIYFGWQVLYLFLFWIVVLPVYKQLINILTHEENPNTVRRSNRRKQMLKALQVSFRSIILITILMATFITLNAFFPILQSYFAMIIYSLSAAGGISVNLNYYREGKTDFSDEPETKSESISKTPISKTTRTPETTQVTNKSSGETS